MKSHHDLQTVRKRKGDGARVLDTARHTRYPTPVPRCGGRIPFRAGLVARAEHRRWASLWRRINGDDHPRPFLSAWPLPQPAAWVAHVNEPQTEAEVDAVRQAVRRSRPFGTDAW